MRKPRIVVEVDESLKKAVKIKASLQGKSMREALDKLLKEWIAQ